MPSNKPKKGWYLARLVFRYEWSDEDKTDPNRLCNGEKNDYLISAISPDEAYAKAIGIGKFEEEEASDCWDRNNPQRTMKKILEGLGSLLPIYDKLEDGAEIAWTRIEDESASAIKNKVREKTELQAFAPSVSPAALF